VLSVWFLVQCSRRPHTGYVAGFGATFLLTLLSSVYYGLFQMLLLCPLAVFLALQHQWYRPTVLLRPWLWTGLVVVIVACAFLLPFYVAYGIESFDRQLENVRWGSAVAGDFFNVTARHWTSTFPGLRIGPVELTLFPGFTLSAAALLSLYLSLDREIWQSARSGLSQVWSWILTHREPAIGGAAVAVLLCIWLFGAPFNVWINLKYDFMTVPWPAVSCSFLALVAVSLCLIRLPGAIRSGWLVQRTTVFWCWCGIAVFALLSMGPLIRLGTLDLAIGPYVLLYRFVPGFHNMQVPGRLCVLLLPLGVIVAACSVEQLLKTPSMAARHWLVVSIATGLLILDLAVRPYAFQRLPLEQDLPAAFQWLRTHPEPGSVLVLPVDTIERKRSPMYLYFAIYHRRPMLNGYASFIPSECATALHKAQSVPDPSAIELLKQRGVRYVVLDRFELEHDLGASALASLVENCSAHAGLRHIPIPSESRYELYELLDAVPDVLDETR
jgi:hypothetical protein